MPRFSEGCDVFLAVRYSNRCGLNCRPLLPLPSCCSASAERGGELNLHGMQVCLGGWSGIAPRASTAPNYRQESEATRRSPRYDPFHRVMDHARSSFLVQFYGFSRCIFEIGCQRRVIEQCSHPYATNGVSDQGRKEKSGQIR